MMPSKTHRPRYAPGFNSTFVMPRSDSITGQSGLHRLRKLSVDGRFGLASARVAANLQSAVLDPTRRERTFGAQPEAVVLVTAGRGVDSADRHFLVHVKANR
jgi:hypothetical protein